MRKHSIVISGHSTSVSLEEEFWDALKMIAEQENKSLSHLIREIDSASHSQGKRSNLSSALRLYVLKSLLERMQR